METGSDHVPVGEKARHWALPVVGPCLHGKKHMLLCAAVAYLQMTWLQLGHRNENRTLGGGAEEAEPCSQTSYRVKRNRTEDVINPSNHDSLDDKHVTGP